MKSPILGGSYVARSVNAADNRMINLFPEPVPEGGKEPAFLQRCPGLTLFSNPPVPTSEPVRAMWCAALRIPGSTNDFEYFLVIAGSDLYVWVAGSHSLSYSGTLTGLDPGANVFMADNGIQVFIGSDDGHKAWVFYMTVAGPIVYHLDSVIDPDYPGAGSVVFMDGFFVVNKPNSQEVYVSALYDGLSWSATAFASAERSSDNVIALAVNNGELWVLGERTTEVWYNAGTPNFPFAPIQGAYFETGCVASRSIAKMDNALFWVGCDARGYGIVYRSHGYGCERVSTHYIEDLLQDIGDPNGTPGVDDTSISAAVAYTYQRNGHTFYVLNVPNANYYFPLPYLHNTLVFDASTQVWHERQSTNPLTAELDAHWGHYYACSPSIGLGLVGSPFGGLYVFNETDFVDYYNDGSGIQQFPCYWMRSWRALPTGQNNLNRTAQHSLQLDIQTGGGGVSDPAIWMMWADDGGNTVNAPRMANLGASGAYGTRVIFRRLGMTMKLRDRVYTIYGTDNCPIFIMGAELILSPTNA